MKIKHIRKQTNSKTVPVHSSRNKVENITECKTKKGVRGTNHKEENDKFWPIGVRLILCESIIHKRGGVQTEA